jgi:hypothetical protein
MKHYIFAGPAAVLIAGELIGSPQANAGCQYGVIAVSRRDGAIQPDSTWQRCVIFNSVNNGSSSSYLRPNMRCDQMGAWPTPVGPRLQRPADAHR